MVERGYDLGTFPVGDWFDCGRPDTLLEANRIALDRMAANGADRETVDDTVIVDPVDIGSDVEIEASVVGPYVSVDDGARISESIVRDSIVGRESDLSRINLNGSIVGNKTVVTGDATNLNIGDNSTLEL
jgi:glucose-1-phosphate thymidylyltransferase